MYVHRGFRVNRAHVTVAHCKTVFAQVPLFHAFDSRIFSISPRAGIKSNDDTALIWDVPPRACMRRVNDASWTIAIITA